MNKDEKMKICILSDGAWATALATVLCHNDHDVCMWGPFADYLKQMAAAKENSRFLPGITLPGQLRFESNIAKAVENAQVILLASPSQYMRQVLEQFKPCFKKSCLLINVAKGIEIKSLLRMSELCREVLGDSRYVVLSGPSHAEEVARRCPTTVVAAGKDAKDVKIVQKLFMNNYFRVYTSSDPTGVELGGALKNVMAIAAGIIDGLKLGDNPKAALITRGVAEIGRLGVLLGGRRSTFSGLSGIGDLMVTCCSGHSRNRHVGEELGRGKTLAQISEEMGMVVAEGVKTAESAKLLADSVGCEAPIIHQIYSVLYEDKDVKDAIHSLMTRKARPEMD